METRIFAEMDNITSSSRVVVNVSAQKQANLNINPPAELTISVEAQNRLQAEVNADKSPEEGSRHKSLKLDGSEGALSTKNSAETDLWAPEQLDKQIKEISKKIKAAQREIQHLAADDSAKAQQRKEILEQELHSLMSQLMGLMAHKTETLNSGAS